MMEIAVGEINALLKIVEGIPEATWCMQVIRTEKFMSPCPLAEPVI